MFNVVKVESVPLKSAKFSHECAAAARRPRARAIIGQAEPMGINVVVAALAAVAGAIVVASAPAARAGADEDAVRAVLDGMNRSYNRADFGGFASHLCAEMRRAAGFEAGWRQSRTSDGPTQITVNSVSVSQTSAVANVRFVAADHDKTLDIEFLREDSEWKACRYRTGQAV